MTHEQQSTPTDAVLTADQARELTSGSKKPLSYTLEVVKAMAKDGNNYATFDLLRVLNPQEQKVVLENAGYKIEITDNHFCVKW